MIIDTQYAGLVFNSIYLVSFILIFSGYLRKGIKSGTSLTSLWLIFVTGMVLFRTGIYLFPMSGPEIRDFLINGRIVEQGEKSIIGGVLGVLGFLIAIAWLKERISVLRGIAVPLILALALQNIGCLVAGCCHGTETSLLWGINYPGHLHAVHPVQLLLFIATLLVAALTYKSQAYFKSPISPLLFGLSLFFLAKMITEFLRDPVTDHSLGYIIFGLKAIQWIQLTVSLILGIACVFSEKYLKEKHSSYNPIVPAWRYISLLLAIMIIAWKIRPLIDFTAAIVLLSAIMVGMILVAWVVFKAYTLPQYRILTISLLLISGFIMSQTYVYKEGQELSYHEWGGNLQFGNFVKQVGIAEASTDCNGNPTIVSTNEQDVRYRNIGAGFHYAKITGKSKYKRNTLGINGFLGYSNGSSINNDYEQFIPYFAVQPFFSTKGRYAGISGGLILGYFHFTTMDSRTGSASVGELTGNPRELYLHPSGGFFLGPYDLLYIKYAHAFNFVSPIPAYSDFLVLGSGLGKTDGRFVELGLSTTGYVAQFAVPFKENTNLNFSANLINEQDFNLKDTYFFTLGFSKKFTYKKSSNPLPR